MDLLCMDLLFMLLRKGGIFIIISDNPWVLGIGVVIFIASLIARVAAEDEGGGNGTQPQIDSTEALRYEICKRCAKKNFDLKQGITCGETGEKPNFTSMCTMFKNKEG